MHKQTSPTDEATKVFNQLADLLPHQREQLLSICRVPLPPNGDRAGRLERLTEIVTTLPTEKLQALVAILDPNTPDEQVAAILDRYGVSDLLPGVQRIRASSPQRAAMNANFKALGPQGREVLQAVLDAFKDPDKRDNYKDAFVDVMKRFPKMKLAKFLPLFEQSVEVLGDMVEMVKE